MNWLRHGSTGVNVERWQNFICGFFPDSRGQLVVDGNFGDATLKFTKKFQSLMGVTPDGVVGNQTLGIAARHGYPLVTEDDDESGPSWPKCPADVTVLSDHERASLFGSFSYIANGTTSNPESIKIIDGWDVHNIISVNIIIQYSLL